MLLLQQKLICIRDNHHIKLAGGRRPAAEAVPGVKGVRVERRIGCAHRTCVYFSA